VALAHNLKSKVVTKLHNQLPPLSKLLRSALGKQEADVKLLNGILVEWERKLYNLLSAEKGRLSSAKYHLTTTVALLLGKASVNKPLAQRAGDDLRGYRIKRAGWKAACGFPDAVLEEWSNSTDGPNPGANRKKDA
jgi:hypothetical protein